MTEQSLCRALRHPFLALPRLSDGGRIHCEGCGAVIRLGEPTDPLDGPDYDGGVGPSERPRGPRGPRHSTHANITA